MIYIRPINENDIDFMWKMLYEMVFIPENKPSKEELLNIPDIKKCLEGWGRIGDKGFIAVNSEGQSIGVGWYRLFNEDNKSYGFIDEEIPELSTALLSEYIGKGIGNQLLARLIEEAKADGYKALSLSVDPDNTAALGLYRKLGFEKCGASGTSWTMKLQL